MTAQNAALELAKELDLPVFPCQPADKRPYTDNGFRDATTDPEVAAPIAFRHGAGWR